MQCEHCKKRKATIFYKENINGHIKEFQLCNDCATVYQQTDELEYLSICMEDFSQSLLLNTNQNADPIPQLNTPPIPKDPPSCPVCGLTLSQLQSNSRMGCETCYAVFIPWLQLPLQLHIPSPSSSISQGKRYPRAYRQRKEKQTKISSLKQELALAITTQAFEKAALLRDEIQALEANL